jgi:type II secretory pathway predicted ATPase ExeA/outer membrane protein OmpA-like peptidoglycan-associated protein
MLNIYLSHYGLEENPFQLTASPIFFWHQKAYATTIRVLKDGLQNNNGIHLLTGEPGTGKTIFINYLSKILEPNFIIAKVPHPDMGCLDFLNSISKSFGVKKQFKSIKAFQNQFRNFLCEASSQNKKALMIIDEAHKITGAILQELVFLLSNTINDKTNINVILVGQNKLNNLVEQPEYNELSTKVVKKCSLGLLNKQETEGYIRHRLKVAGTTSKIFSSGAVRQIFLFSKGNPRLINTICDHALLSGYSSGRKSIDSSVIKECADELQIVAEEKDRSRIEIVATKVRLPISSIIFKLFRNAQILTILVLMLLVTFGYLFMVTRTDRSSKSLLKQLAQEKYLRIREKIDAVEAGESSLTDSFDASGINNNIDQKELQLEKKTILDLARTDYKIYFDSNSNELTNEAAEILNQIVKDISEHPVYEITILGYSDSSGNPQNNVKLSKLRADIVKKYLVSQRISQEIITSFGLGPKNPIASNKTHEGRRKNRRVEIKINFK